MFNHNLRIRVKDTLCAFIAISLLATVGLATASTAYAAEPASTSPVVDSGLMPISVPIPGAVEQVGSLKITAYDEASQLPNGLEEYGTESGFVTKPAALAPLVGSKVPAFLTQERNFTRSVTVQNSSEKPITVQGISAKLVSPASTATRLVQRKNGSNALAAPLAPVEVAPGATELVKFNTTSPLANEVVMNKDRLVTGFSTTFVATVEVENQAFTYKETVSAGSEIPGNEGATGPLLQGCTLPTGQLEMGACVGQGSVAYAWAYDSSEVAPGPVPAPPVASTPPTAPVTPPVASTPPTAPSSTPTAVAPPVDPTPPAAQEPLNPSHPKTGTWVPWATYVLPFGILCLLVAAVAEFRIYRRNRRGDAS
jgi:hypothetical protein